MTDYTQYFTKPYGTPAPESSVGVAPPPDYLSYNEWGADAATGDETKDLINYSNYVRKTHADADAYNDNVEANVQRNLVTALGKRGLVDPSNPDDVASVLSTPAPSFDVKAQTLQQLVDLESETGKKLLDYNAHMKAVSKLSQTDPSLENAPHVIEKTEALRAQVTDLVEGADWNNAVKKGVYSGELLAGRVVNEDGSSEVRINGDWAAGLSTSEIIKQTEHLGIGWQDAYAIGVENQVVSDKGYTRAQMRERYDIGAQIATALDSEYIEGQTQRGFEEEREGYLFLGLHTDEETGVTMFMSKNQYKVGTAANRLKHHYKNAVKNLVRYDEERAGGNGKAAVGAQKRLDASIAEIASIMNDSKQLSDKGGVIDTDKIRDVVEQMAAGQAEQQAQFKFYADEDKLKYNVRNYGFQDPVIHMAAIPRKELFDQVLEAAKDDYTPQQLDALRKNRGVLMEQQFDSYNQSLSLGGKSDEWLGALQEGRASGASDVETLENFLADEENFSSWKARTASIAWTVPQAIKLLPDALGVALGEEWATESMMRTMRFNEASKETARLFGYDHTNALQQGAEMIAPVLTDVALTTVLASFTGGAGGAGYLAARAGAAATAKTAAKVTLKGITKGVTSGAFKIQGREGAEAAVKRLVRDGFLTAPKTKAAEKGAMGIITQFNKIQSGKLATIPAMAMPAFNRSAGMTYAGAYKTLSDNNPDMTHEEKHDRALGAGLVAGSFTGFITGAFGALGASGAEGAFLQGMSKRQAAKTVQRLLGRGEKLAHKNDELLRGVLKQAGIKASAATSRYSATTTFLGEVLQNTSGEAAEEFIDEFAQGIISDAYTNETTPLADRVSQAGFAAVMGGAFGLGMPLVGKALTGPSRAERNFMQRVQKRELERKTIDDVVTRLQDKGADATAEMVGTLLRGSARDIEGARAAYDRYKQTMEAGTEIVPYSEPTTEGPAEPLPTPDAGAPAPEAAEPIPEAGGAPEFETTDETPVDRDVPRGEETYDPAAPSVSTPASTVQVGQKVRQENGNIATVVTVKRNVTTARGDTFDTVVGLSNGGVLQSVDGQDSVPVVDIPVAQEAAPEEQQPIEVESEIVTPEPETQVADEVIPLGTTAEAGTEAEPEFQPDLNTSEPFIRQVLARAIRDNGVADADFMRRQVEAITGEETPVDVYDSPDYTVDQEGNITGVLDPETGDYVGKTQEQQDVETVFENAENGGFDRAYEEVLAEEAAEAEAEEAPIQLGLIIDEASAADTSYDIDTDNNTTSPLGIEAAAPFTEAEIANIETAGIDTAQLTAERNARAVRQEAARNIPDAVLEGESPTTLDEEAEVLFGEGDPNGNYEKMQQIISGGFPVMIQKKTTYGLTLKGTDAGFMRASSEYEAQQIYAKWPPIIMDSPPQGGRVIKNEKRPTWFNPATNSVNRNLQKVYLDADDNVVFDNNPITMDIVIDPNDQSTYVRIPDDFDLDLVNPAFIRDPVEGNNRVISGIRKPDELTGATIAKEVGTTDDQIPEQLSNTQIFEAVSAANSVLNMRRQTADGQFAPIRKLTVRTDSIPTGRTTKLEPMAEGETITVQQLMNNVAQYIMGTNPTDTSGFGTKFKPRNGRILDDAFYYDGINTLYTKYEQLASAAAIKEVILQDALEFVTLTETTNAKGETIRKYELKSDSLTSRAALLRLAMPYFDAPNNATGITKVARAVNPLLRVARRDSNDLVATTNYILDNILNADPLPNIDNLGRSVANTMGGQQETRIKQGRLLQAEAFEYDASRTADPTADPNDDASSSVGYDEETDAAMQTPRSDAKAPERSDVYKTIDQQKYTLDVIEDNPALRTSFNNLVLTTIYNNTPAEKTHVRRLTTQELARQAGEFITKHGQGNARVIKFFKALNDSTNSAMVAVRKAMVITNQAPASTNGRMSQDADAVNEFASNFTSNAVPEEFIKQYNGQTKRSRQAKSRVTRAGMKMANEINNAEANRLGLVSGDPESVIRALRSIAADKLNPSHALVAELLLENEAFIRTVEFQMTELNLSDTAGLYTKYQDGAHSVMLNMNGHNGKGLTNVLLEEYIHAILSDTVTTPKEMLSPDQQAALTRLENLMAEIKDAAVAAGYAEGSPIFDSLVNMDEFVAGILLSQELQNEIRALANEKEAGKGFFKRIVDAIMRFFRSGVTKAEADAYTNAIADVIRLKKNTGSVDMFTQAKRIAKAAMSRMSERNYRYNAIGFDNLYTTDSIAAEASKETELSAEEEGMLFSAIADAEQAAKEKVDAAMAYEFDEDAIDMDDFDGIGDAREFMNALLQYIRDRIPPEVEVHFDGASSSYVNFRKAGMVAGMKSGALYFNPEKIFAATRGMDMVSAKMLMESVVEEELAHVASYNELTQAEIDSIIENMSVHDFTVIAEKYYFNNAPRLAALKKLFSTKITEDMTAAEKTQLLKNLRREKRALIEEHLRAQTQRITRGYTTEEDYAFWKSNPSMMKVLWRYVTGVFRRLAAARNIRGSNRFMDLAVGRMVEELRAIKSGYRLNPTHLSFDPNNAENSYRVLAMLTQEDIVAHPEEFVRQLQDNQLLAAAFAAFNDPELEALAKIAQGDDEDAVRLYAAQMGEDLDAPQEPLADRVSVNVKAYIDKVNRLRIKAIESVADKLTSDRRTLDRLQGQFGEDVPKEFFLQTISDIESYLDDMHYIGGAAHQNDSQIASLIETVILNGGASSAEGWVGGWMNKHNPMILDESGDKFYGREDRGSAINIIVDNVIDGIRQYRNSFESNNPLTGSEMVAVRRVASIYLNELYDVQENSNSLPSELQTPTSFIKAIEGSRGASRLSRGEGVMEALKPLIDSGFMEVYNNQMMDTSGRGRVQARIGNKGSKSDIEFTLEDDGSIDIFSMFPLATNQDTKLSDNERAFFAREENQRRNPVPNMMPLVWRLLLHNHKIGISRMTTHGIGSGSTNLKNLSALDIQRKLIERSDLTAEQKEHALQKLKDNTSGDPTKGYAAWGKLGFEFRGGPMPLYDFIADAYNQNFANRTNVLMRNWLANNMPEAWVQEHLAKYQFDQMEVRTNAYLDNAEVRADIGAGRDSRAIGNLRYLIDLDDFGLDELSQSQQQAVQARFAEIQAGVHEELNEMIELGTIKDGDGVDLFSMQALMSHGTKGEAVWNSLGFDTYYEFDLSLGSESMATLSRKIAPLIKREIRQRQRRASKGETTLTYQEKLDADVAKWLASQEALGNDDVVAKAVTELEAEAGEEAALQAELDEELTAWLGGEDIDRTETEVADEQTEFDLDTYVDSLIDEGGDDAAMYYTSIGDIGVGDTDFSGFIKTLDMPVYKTGDYEAPTRWYNTWFKGAIDQRVSALHDHRKAFLRASEGIVDQYKERLDGHIKKTFGKEPSEADRKLLADAIGDARGVQLDQDVLDEIDMAYREELRALRKEQGLSAEQFVAKEAEINRRKDAEIVAKETQKREAILRTKQKAMAQIEQLNPNLAQHLRDIREQLITPLSTYVRDNFGLTDEIKATFDSNMDIYITRSYRMFTDVGFNHKVRHSPEYKQIREEAARFFNEQYVKDQVKAMMDADDNLSEEDAIAAAINKRDRPHESGKSLGERKMEEFLESYSPERMSDLAKDHAETYRVLMDNLKAKKNLAPEIRALLGEYGQDGTVDNLLRTFTVVAKMSANQAFLVHLKEMGTKEGFLVTKEQKDADPERYEDYVQIRPSQHQSDADPLRGLYGPPEMLDGFLKTFDRTKVRGMLSEDEVAVSTVGALAKKATGWSMAAKTLGGIAFYVRNLVSNMFFFGPAQGYYTASWDSSVILLQRGIKKVKGVISEQALDAEIAELTSYGIIGDEVRSQTMKALMRGETSPDKLLEEQEKAIGRLKHVKKGMDLVYKKAGETAALMDAVYKIGYYKKEIRVLQKAVRQAEVGSELHGLSPEQIKREAARKVLMTAQAHSQAPPIITKAERSSFGLMMAPFLRFKAEVPRIVINTYRLGVSEVKSDNPVIRKRGISRMTNMTVMLGVWSSAVPVILSKIAGIGEDEDEALRKSMPHYLRNHSFYFWRNKQGNLTSWDLTYLNPFSLMADPVLRAGEELRKGNVIAAGGKFLSAAFFDQYLDPQILAGTIMDLAENVDANTDNPIVEEHVDDTKTGLAKQAWYLLKQAYGPDLGKKAVLLSQSIRAGEGARQPEDEPMAIILSAVMPVKPHPIDLEKQLTRYLYDVKDAYSRARRKKYRAYGRKPLTEDAVAELYHKEVRDLTKLNNDLVRVLRGFNKLGMPTADQYRIMTKKNIVPKRRARNVLSGFMDKPVVSPDYFKNLIAKSQGANPTMTEDEAYNRANTIFKAVASYEGKYLELEEKYYD